MNPPSNDSPELTAYALGELSGAQAAAVHDLLATLPAALSELEQVEAVTEALRQGAPIPQQRLTPDQRHSVLHPANLPRRVTPMQPRPLQVRRKPVIWPAVTFLAKAAAIVTVTAVAFSLGRRTSLEPAQSTDVTTASVKESPGSLPSQSPLKASRPAPEKPKLVVVEKPVVPALSAPAPEKPAIVVLPATPAPAIAQAPPAAPPKSVEPVAVAKQPAAATKPAAATVASLSITANPRGDAFINASRKPNDLCELRPAKIRPLPVKVDKSKVFASPAPSKLPPEAKDNSKGRPPELFIHSWKADVVTCPWNESNRLLRVVIQLPADQPAVIASTSAYPLQVNFDPNNVRGYRMLSEQHQPAAELRSAGKHVIWYEFQPNGSADPAREVGKWVATITLPSAHFTTQTVGPFDGSKLRVMDRNQSWQNAREDIVFESSVVGFGMLLRGIPETSKLNQQLVLDLATKAKGADPTGERARFIRLVQDAKIAAGL